MSLRESLGYPTLAVAAALAVYQYQAMEVGAARERLGVKAPATTGNEEFERIFRAHQNTLESLPVFIPSVYAFAHYVHPLAAGVLGGVYAVGRLLFGLGYAKHSDNREWGFNLSLVASCALYLGATAGVVRHLYLTRPH